MSTADLPQAPPRLITPQAELEVGLGAADITPPPDAYHRNWGAALHDAAAGCHLPLRATALVVRPHGGGPECLLVTLDLGWLRTREVLALLAAVSQRTGVPTQRLLLAFSHTHAAINLDVTRSQEPGGQHIEPYLAQLPDRIAAAAAAARADLRAVRLTFARGRCSLAVNRDFVDPVDGTFACGPNPAGPTDDTVWVAAATDAAGRRRAILVNYACHPTTLAWENQLLSPDYPGAMRALVEDLGGAPCMFLLGPCGDLGPRDGFVGDPQVAERNGRQLGYAALEALTGMAPPGTAMEYTGKVVSGATLGIWQHLPLAPPQQDSARICRATQLVVEVPHRQLPGMATLEAHLAAWQARETDAVAAGDDAGRRDARAHVERARRAMRRLEELPDPGATSVQYRVSLWQLGQAVLVGLGGEPYNLLQRELRSRFPHTPILFAVLCNEPYSYILPAPLCGTGRYQDECATLAAGALERIVSAVDGALRGWGLA